MPSLDNSSHHNTEVVRKSVSFSDPIEQNAAYPSTSENMSTMLLGVLNDFENGNSTSYHSLVQDIQKGKLGSSQISLLIQCLSSQVSSIHVSMKKLVEAILGVSWITQSCSFTAVYETFFENLVSANATFSTTVCKMLVSHLSKGTSQIPNDISPSQLFDTIHHTLSRVLKLVPSGPSLLMPILISKYPHKTSPLDAHLLYVKSLLHIMSYVPVLQKPILLLIIDGMVQIDVEIQIELEDLEEEQIESVQSIVSRIDNLDTLNSYLADQQDSSLGNDESIQETDEDGYESDDEYSVTSHIISTDVIPMIQRLDALMTLLLQHYKDLSEKSKNDIKASDALALQFTYLLDAFDTTLLATHRVRCVQFIVFYVSSLSPEFPEQFLGLLVSRTFSDKVSPVIRVCSSAYLASYVARTTFISFEHVRMGIRLLTEFAIKYIESIDSPSSSSTAAMNRLDIDRHSVFYAVTQAILYIFCFKWKQLQTTSQQMPLIGRFAPELSDFQTVLLSKLCPLRVCSQTIVEEFAKITLHLDIMYCYSLMYPSTASPEMSRSSSRASNQDSPRESKSTSPTDESSPIQKQTPQNQPYSLVERLDTFFPFDPLSLPRSRLFLTSLYQEWQSEDEDDKSSNSDDDDSDDFAKELGVFADEEEGSDDESSIASFESAEQHVMDYLSNQSSQVV